MVWLQMRQEPKGPIEVLGLAEQQLCHDPNAEPGVENGYAVDTTATANDRPQHNQNQNGTSSHLHDTLHKARSLEVRRSAWLHWIIRLQACVAICSQYVMFAQFVVISVQAIEALVSHEITLACQGTLAISQGSSDVRPLGVSANPQPKSEPCELNGTTHHAASASSKSISGRASFIFTSIFTLFRYPSRALNLGNLL